LARFDGHPVQYVVLFRFLYELRDTLLVVNLENSETPGFLSRNGKHRNRDVRFAARVMGDKIPEIQLIELITGKDKHIFRAGIIDVP
jgi:hypothetical protein